MSNRLDMPLDEIIELNKQQSRGGGPGGGRGRMRGRGAGRRGGSFRGSSRGAKTAFYLRPRSSAQSLAKSYKNLRSDMARRRGDVFEDVVGSALGIETGTKLQISNLDYGVSNEDIKELFSELGELKHYGVHYDRSGRSNGTADVVYVRHRDALAAIKRYNTVLLDGKPMRIDLSSMNVPAARASTMVGRGRSSVVSRGRGRGLGSGGSRGRSRGRGRGRGQRVAPAEKKAATADELDADLERYHKDAMDTF